MPTKPRRTLGAAHRTLAFVIWIGAVCLMAAAARAQTATGVWQPLGGPPGRISHLAARPDGSALYAVSVALTYRADDQTQWLDSGKAARSDALYWSQDAGATWRPLTNDLPPAPITALYADAHSERLFAGLAGELWAGAPRTGWSRIALDREGLVIRRIVRGAGGQDLYFGAHKNDPTSASYVYRSRDEGRTWTSAEPLTGAAADVVLDDLIVAPDDPNRLFVTTHHSRLYHSVDAGATWAVLQTVGEEPAERLAAPARLAINPDKPRTLIFVRSSERAGLLVERSDDGGASWQRLNAAGLPATTRIRALTGAHAGVFLLNSDHGTFRSADNGATWQPLEGALSSGGVAEFLAWPERAAADRPGAAAGAEPIVLAATGYGVFLSRDGGALWQPRAAGLPFNSRILGLLTNPKQPGHIWALMDTRPIAETAPPPLVLRSLDGGGGWLPAARGLPEAQPMAWAADLTATDPGVLIATRDHFFRTRDAGLSWQATPLPAGDHTAIAIAPANPQVIYLGGRPALRSADRGASWQPMPVARFTPEAEPENAAVTGLAVDPANADHLWAGLEDGVVESKDGGRTWQAVGLAEKKIRWLQGIAPAGQPLLVYAGVAGEGIYRLAPPAERWDAASQGLPDRSVVLSLLHDPARPGLLWATRDGGGVYGSADGGATWANLAAGLGDNLAPAAALDFVAASAGKPAGDAGVLIGTANAGIWAQAAPTAVSDAARPAGAVVAPPQALDARIELVWPHGGAAVTEARLANIGFRLFGRDSLEPPPCGWSPRVTLWQAFNHSPAESLGEISQRTVDGQPFPFWELNDVDVSRAADSGNKIYFMVRSNGPALATSIWTHGADPRTFFPQQDVPSGLAAGPIDAVDARIQIVWPHDAAGIERPASEATLANLAVLFFKHGTRLSAPAGWQPQGITLVGAWNHEVSRPLAQEAVPGMRTAGAITYPYWEFTNIPVARAIDPANRLYLWVQVDGVETYPTIWAHGADARTVFPVPDEPIRGCVP